MKRIGIFGGSFDPPHLGHIKAAECFIRGAELDKLIIVPSAVPPHKSLSNNVCDSVRLEMTKIAFSSLSDKIEVSDFECNRGGVNYSYDTVLNFRKKYPDDKFFLFVGTDNFCEFETWHEYEKLFHLVTLTCMPRDEKTSEILEKKKLYERTYDAEILILSDLPYIISSTKVREELKNNGFSYSIIPELNDFIELNFLYKTELFDKTRTEIIKRLKSNLPENRINHILSVERECAFISKLVGLCDEEIKNMRYSALLHDVTRYLSVDEHEEICKKYGYVLAENDKQYPTVLHSITGSLYAKYEYGLPEYAYNAIKYHTAGKDNMTVYEKILWLCDYIEAEREHKSCKLMREKFYSLINECTPIKALQLTLLDAMEFSVNYLKKNEKNIHPLSLTALSFLREETKKYGNN